MYHWGENFCSIGFVVHLNYNNPWLEPFGEFQRAKTHPAIAQISRRRQAHRLWRARHHRRRLPVGAASCRFPGGALIGCAAGFVNLPRIKGSHNAMKTGMLAAEAAFAALKAGRAGDTLQRLRDGLCQKRGGQGPEAGAQRQAALVEAGNPAGAAFHRAGPLDQPAVRLFPVRNPGSRQTGLCHPEKSDKIASPSPIPSPTEISPSTGFPASSSPTPTMRKTSRCIWCCAIRPFRLR